MFSHNIILKTRLFIKKKKKNERGNPNPNNSRLKKEKKNEYCWIKKEKTKEFK